MKSKAPDETGTKLALASKLGMFNYTVNHSRKVYLC